MTEPIDSPASPEKEPVSGKLATDNSEGKVIPGAPTGGVSARPPVRRMGPRSPGGSVPRDIPEVLESGWATAAFLLVVLSVFAGLFGLCVWGIVEFQGYRSESDQRSLIDRTEFTLPAMTYDHAFTLLNGLRPLETDDERSQDLTAGFAKGELGTDEATSKELTQLLQRVARANGSDPIHRYLSRPHLIRRILPIVPDELCSDFALDPERIMGIGYEDPVVILVRVRHWETGHADEVGRVVYAYLRASPDGDALPFRFWVVRESDGWHCVDYELTFYGVSSGEMAALKVCTMICPGDKSMEVLQRISDWVDPRNVQDPQKDLDWIVSNIRQLPAALRDWNMMLSLQSLREAGLKDELYYQGMAGLSFSTRCIIRGNVVATSHSANGRWEECLKECDSFRNRFGETSPTVTLARANALLALERFDDAVLDLEIISQRLPTEESVIPCLALACPPGDITPLISAVLRHPKSGDAIRQGYYALSASRGTNSLKQFVEALSRDNRFRADTARLSSWLALGENDSNTALESMRKAFELSDKTRRDEFRSDLFYLMLSHGQAAQACGLFNDDASLVAILIEALKEESWPEVNEQIEQLVEVLKRVVTSRPQDYEAWFLLGHAQTSLKKWDDALIAFAQSLQVQPLEKAGTPDQSSLELERQKLAYYDRILALRSASRWNDLEQVMERDGEVAEYLASTLGWMSQDDFIAWMKRFAEQHEQASVSLNLQSKLAEQAEDWSTARKHLATLIQREKDEDKKGRLRSRLAVAIIQDPNLDEAVNDLKTSKVLDIAGQILLQDSDSQRLPRFIAAVKDSRAPRGIRSRLPYWEAQGWAQIGRFHELSSPAITKALAKSARDDVDATRSLIRRWDGQTPGLEPVTIKTVSATAEDNDQDRTKLAVAVRRADLATLQNLLSDRQYHELLQQLYHQPAYAALWSDEFRSIRELAPPRLASSYRSGQVVVLQSGDAPDQAAWEAKLNDLSGILGRTIEPVPLHVITESPARQAHRIRAGDQECFVAIGIDQAREFELNTSYSRLTPEQQTLLNSHRWWIQVWPARSDSSIDHLWSEAVAAGLISERTIAIYLGDELKALVEKGTEQFRLAALEIHRFSQSHLPWSDLDRQKLQQTSGVIENLWWRGPEQAISKTDIRLEESISLFEQYRSCLSDQVVRAVVQESVEWFTDRLEVDVERCIIDGGGIEEIRCRVVTPSPLYPRLSAGEPILVPQYRLNGSNTVSRLAVRQAN